MTQKWNSIPDIETFNHQQTSLQSFQTITLKRHPNKVGNYKSHTSTSNFQSPFHKTPKAYQGTKPRDRSEKSKVEEQERTLLSPADQKCTVVTKEGQTLPEIDLETIRFLLRPSVYWPFPRAHDQSSCDYTGGELGHGLALLSRLRVFRQSDWENVAPCALF